MMYTLCPHCSTCFRLTPEHLNAAAGNVRCGNCGAVFNALDNLAHEPEPPEELLTTEEEEILLNDPWDPEGGGGEREVEMEEHTLLEEELPLEKDPLLDDEPWDQPLPEETAELGEDSLLYAEQEFPPLGGEGPKPDAATASTTSKPAVPDLPQATEEELHESYLDSAEDITIEELERLILAEEEKEERGEKPGREPIHPLVTTESGADGAPRRRSLLSAVLDNWMVTSAGSLLLILLLLGQYIWYARDHLAQHYPETRPLLGMMCDHLGCRLPLRRDPDRMQITARDVRTHPKAKGALLINATFVNRAPFRQPYPLVELRLSNLRGKEIGRRTFLPREYLVGEPDIEAGIPPDGQVYLVLEVMDPDGQAVNFQFDFH